MIWHNCINSKLLRLVTIISSVCLLWMDGWYTHIHVLMCAYLLLIIINVRTVRMFCVGVYLLCMYMFASMGVYFVLISNLCIFPKATRTSLNNVYMTFIKKKRNKSRLNIFFIRINPWHLAISHVFMTCGNILAQGIYLT